MQSYSHNNQTAVSSEVLVDSLLLPNAVIEGIVATLGLRISKDNLALLVDEVSHDTLQASGRKWKYEHCVDFEAFVHIVHDVRIQKIPRSAKKRDFLPIDPDTACKQGWDFLIMALLVYTCFSVPYTLVFQEESIGIFSSDLALDMLFMIDVGLSFVTAYSYQGVYITNLRTVGLHYMKTWFLLDFAGSFPFGKVVPLH